MKFCTDCCIDMPKTKFSIGTNKDGLQSVCKLCVKIRNHKYIKTEAGVISTIYGSQRASSKSRLHEMPNYSKEELAIWLYNNGFKVLYDKWVDSDYDKWEKPSCDRHDDYKPYTFDNIELKTWRENDAKQKQDIHLGRSTSGKAHCKVVVQYDLDGNFIDEFYSIQEASKCTNSHQGHIVSVCGGKRKSHNGFKWKYKE